MTGETLTRIGLIVFLGTSLLFQCFAEIETGAIWKALWVTISRIFIACAIVIQINSSVLIKLLTTCQMGK